MYFNLFHFIKSLNLFLYSFINNSSLLNKPIFTLILESINPISFFIAKLVVLTYISISLFLCASPFAWLPKRMARLIFLLFEIFSNIFLIEGLFFIKDNLL